MENAILLCQRRIIFDPPCSILLRRSQLLARLSTPHESSLVRVVIHPLFYSISYKLNENHFAKLNTEARHILLYKYQYPNCILLSISTN